jgi:hypothetical protein
LKARSQRDNLVAATTKKNHLKIFALGISASICEFASDVM